MGLSSSLNKTFFADSGAIREVVAFIHFIILLSPSAPKLRTEILCLEHSFAIYFHLGNKSYAEILLSLSKNPKHIGGILCHVDIKVYLAIRFLQNMSSIAEKEFATKEHSIGNPLSSNGNTNPMHLSVVLSYSTRLLFQ